MKYQFVKQLSLSILFLVLWQTKAACKDIYTPESYYKLDSTVIATELNHPWCISFLSAGEVLVTERSGTIKRVNLKNGQISVISGLPNIKVGGQGGLFDVALHPNFKNNKIIFFSFNGVNNGKWGTELARAKLINDRLSEIRILFKLEPKSTSNHHFGGRILFDAGNNILLTTGDRGDRNRAQKTNDHAGSIIRLNLVGNIPKDNPFFYSETSKKEIITLGHRNIQGIAKNPDTGEIWAHEHGPQGGDELNLIEMGSNYGWPIVTFGVNYGIGTKIGEGTSKEGMKDPVYKWIPSIASSGMVFVTGDHFKKWRNNILLGSLKFNSLVMLELKNKRVLREQLIFKNKFGRIRDVKIGPDGFIYIITDHRKGQLIQLKQAE
ncbi:MAG: hypothetical protein CBC42_01315 [Betaproteobacteria bacterium TMED82]|nr:MAG: hypothetical protein CBC42_01315 [Betaproteobacteria bacterium TMED82]